MCERNCEISELERLEPDKATKTNIFLISFFHLVSALIIHRLTPTYRGYDRIRLPIAIDRIYRFFQSPSSTRSRWLILHCHTKRHLTVKPIRKVTVIFFLRLNFTRWKENCFDITALPLPYGLFKQNIATVFTEGGFNSPSVLNNLIHKG